MGGGVEEHVDCLSLLGLLNVCVCPPLLSKGENEVRGEGRKAVGRRGQKGGEEGWKGMKSEGEGGRKKGEGKGK